MLPDEDDRHNPETTRHRADREQHDEAMCAVGLDPGALRTPEAKARARTALYVSPEQAAGGKELARKLAAGEDVQL